MKVNLKQLTHTFLPNFIKFVTSISCGEFYKYERDIYFLFQNQEELTL